MVERNLVALVIGKGGSNIRDIEDKYNVKIIIEKEEGNNNDHQKKVIIIGKDKRSVEMATEDVNLQRTKIEVDGQNINYVCGSHDSNLRYFEQQAKIISVNVERSSKDKNIYYLEVIGKESANEEFKTLIQTHLDYQDHFE
jgi:predicted PilT family ATPase